MVTVCAWCQKILKVTTDHVDLVSHGICEKCSADVKREKRGARRA
jgi:hypothetical protein